MARVLLKDLAYARSGDKGDISNIGVVAFNEKNYQILKREMTPERVKGHFGPMVKGEVKIYELPNILSFNVVLYEGLGGGATRTLRYDQTGKAMATALYRLQIETD